MAMPPWSTKGVRKASITASSACCRPDARRRSRYTCAPARCSGSAWAAAGRLIGYYEPHMNPWDALPGLVLMREAGGASNDFLAQEGIQRGNPLLLASPTLYPQLKKMIPQPLH
ncbi:inositol monophosphatase family protein [Klebsiella pneumoniae]|nr:inositol monophosphatase family protein [Klebsiella pneumoniae]